MKRMGLYDKLVDDIRNRARQNPKTIVFADANNLKVLKGSSESDQ